MRVGGCRPTEKRRRGEHLAELLAGIDRGRDIVVVGENDKKPDGKWPGKEGAESSAKASENVAVEFPHSTPPARSDSGDRRYINATTEYNPNGHGADRNTVRRDQPRVVSRPKHERHS